MLTHEDKEVYVNANRVKVAAADREYILTQGEFSRLALGDPIHFSMFPPGPLDCTVDDFWLMVQQENSDTIVMLCNCVEMHKEKSAQYWPEKPGETLLLGENREGVDLEVKGLISQQRWPNI